MADNWRLELLLRWYVNLIEEEFGELKVAVRIAIF
jgi:hypothetical protein